MTVTPGVGVVASGFEHGPGRAPESRAEARSALLGAGPVARGTTPERAEAAARQQLEHVVGTPQTDPGFQGKLARALKKAGLDDNAIQGLRDSTGTISLAGAREALVKQLQQHGIDPEKLKNVSLPQLLGGAQQIAQRAQQPASQAEAPDAGAPRSEPGQRPAAQQQARRPAATKRQHRAQRHAPGPQQALKPPKHRDARARNHKPVHHAARKPPVEERRIDAAADKRAADEVTRLARDHGRIRTDSGRYQNVAAIAEHLHSIGSHETRVSAFETIPKALQNDVAEAYNALAQPAARRSS